jgi:hypothetical protein
MVTHMLQRAWGQGAVCTTGRVRGGALLSKDAQSCVSPPNDTQGRRVFAWSGSHTALAKSSSQKGGVGTVGKVTRRDDSQASSWPSWIYTLILRERVEPTDKRTYFSTRGLGSAHAPPASGRKVINHLSPLPVACRHAALLFRTRSVRRKMWAPASVQW